MARIPQERDLIVQLIEQEKALKDLQFIVSAQTFSTTGSGATGPQGATGSAATISVGTTSTGAAGSSALVTNSGTSGAAIFNFTIPRGDKGDTGSTGATGSTGSAATIAVGTVTTLAAGSSATVANSGTSSAATFDFSIPQGAKGDTGEQGTSGNAMIGARVIFLS